MKKVKNTSSGIYYLRLGDRTYVGKDHEINREKRIVEHKNYLRRGAHYNKDMQEAYDKGENLISGIIVNYGASIDDKLLCECEKYWIAKLDAYTEGFNKTIGGIGGGGIIFTQEMLEAKSRRVTGDKNPMSKLSLDDFLAIVKMLQSGKNNKEISERFGLHDRYVSLIRNKRRYVTWFKEYAPEYTIVSGRRFQRSNFKLSEAQVKEIQNIITHTDKTNVAIGKEYGVDPSTISRIRTKLKQEG